MRFKILIYFKCQVTSEILFLFLIFNYRGGQCLVVSLVGMTAFKTVSKARIGKFRQKILFICVKVIYLLNYEIDKSNSDESLF